MKITHPPDGDIKEVADRFRLGPNDVFGEMALFSSQVLKARAKAVEQCSVLRIPSTAIHELIASNQRMQQFVAMNAIDRLRETECFCKVTPSTVARLVSFMNQVEFDAGDLVFTDVDENCPIYLVVLGSVELTYTSQREYKDRIVEANQLLGTDHLAKGRSVQAMAVALEPTTLLVVERSNIDKLCKDDDRFRLALIESGMVGVFHGTVDPEKEVHSEPL